MFSKKEIMLEAFYSSSDWSGGLYSTPSAAGSRNGGPSVGACKI